MIISGEQKIIIGVVVTTVVLLIGGVFLLSRNAPATPSQKVDASQTLSADAYSIGNKDAKVKIAEYSDLQCPACQQAHTPLKQFLEEYKDKVYFEYHHFPLDVHQNAVAAAQAAEAAGEQGKFFEYTDKLFEKQTDWATNTNPKNLFKQYAKDVSLDEATFTQAIDSNKFTQKVLDHRGRGNKLSVQATPTFFINGERIEGGLSKEEWKKKADELLSK